MLPPIPETCCHPIRCNVATNSGNMLPCSHLVYFSKLYNTLIKDKIGALNYEKDKYEKDQRNYKIKLP